MQPPDSEDLHSYQYPTSTVIVRYGVHTPRALRPEFRFPLRANHSTGIVCMSGVTGAALPNSIKAQTEYGTQLSAAWRSVVSTLPVTYLVIL